MCYVCFLNYATSSRVITCVVMKFHMCRTWSYVFIRDFIKLTCVMCVFESIQRFHMCYDEVSHVQIVFTRDSIKMTCVMCVF